MRPATLNVAFLNIIIFLQVYTLLIIAKATSLSRVVVYRDGLWSGIPIAVERSTLSVDTMHQVQKCAHFGSLFSIPQLLFLQFRKFW